jgi:peroxiredoxin
MTKPTRSRATAKRHRLAPWLAFFAPVFALGVVLAVAIATAEDAQDAGASAPDFALSDTAGNTVSLADVTDGQDALLFFSMGVGCDGCFLQIPEIEDRLAARGIALVPIMVDPADWLAAEAARLGVDSPILVDADRNVSAAYDMLGQHGHGDTPSHSFALVTTEGEIEWVRHYAEMFVPADRLLADLPA